MARAGKAEVNRMLAQAAAKDAVIAEVREDQKQALAEVDKMRKELEALKAQVAAQASGGGGGPAVVNNNTTVHNTTTDNRTQINFNFFGGEDVSHLKENIRALLASGRPAHDVIGRIGDLVWCDPKHPENGTMFNPNVKDTRVRTLRADGKWETRDRDVVHREAHTALTNHAYNNQPRTEKGARAADPILKQMDAIDQGKAPFPTGVYNAITEGGRVHKHTRRR